MKAYLQATPFIDFDQQELVQLACSATRLAKDDAEKARHLYYLVRDRWRYYPYDIRLEPASNRASCMLSKSYGHCLDKAVLLISLARSCGIAARLRLAKVRNHIATDRFVQILGTDELVPHGIAELWLHKRWVKLTPAFNQQLCSYLNVATLEFDGKNDALFQEFDHKGAIFMEYLEDYGHFADFPLKFVRQLLLTHYPSLFVQGDLQIPDSLGKGPSSA